MLFMNKDFDKWHTVKIETNKISSKAFCHKREVWWCNMGANIGYEIDGKGEYFTRPVLIIAKFNLDMCLVVPFTTNIKKNKYYIYAGIFTGKKSYAIMSQMRLIDRRRLRDKIDLLSREKFTEIISFIKDDIFK